MPVIKPTKEELAARRAAVKERHAAERKAAKLETRTLAKVSKASEAPPADVRSVAVTNKALAAGSDVKKALAGSKIPKQITSAREKLAEAFDLMGGVPSLVRWGKDNPTEFYRMWSRLIPKEAAEAPSMPLETLLEKLATREEMSVGAAAMEIGMEMIEKGRLGAELEDLENLTKGTLQ